MYFGVCSSVFVSSEATVSTAPFASVSSDSLFSASDSAVEFASVAADALALHPVIIPATIMEAINIHKIFFFIIILLHSVFQKQDHYKRKKILTPSRLC